MSWFNNHYNRYPHPPNHVRWIGYNHQRTERAWTSPNRVSLFSDELEEDDIVIPERISNQSDRAG